MPLTKVLSRDWKLCASRCGEGDGRRENEMEQNPVQKFCFFADIKRSDTINGSCTLYVLDERVYAGDRSSSTSSKFRRCG